MRASLGLAALGASLSLGACQDRQPDGWRNQPIPIRIQGGIPLIGITFASGPTQTAVIDSGAPVTVVSSYGLTSPFPAIAGHPWAGKRLEVHPDSGAGALRTGQLRLLDADHAGVTRFIFHEQDVFDLRLERAGLGTPIAVQAQLGVSVLGRFAFHLDYGERSAALILRDQIPDTDEELAADCEPRQLLDGVQPSPGCSGVVRVNFSGGGTTEIGGREVQVPATRAVVPACLAPALFDPASATRATIKTTGQDASAAVFTGIGTTVIARSAFERLQANVPGLIEPPAKCPCDAPLVCDGGVCHALMHLAYGSERVQPATIDGMALVDSLTRDLGPCAELARRRRLLYARREGIDDFDVGHNGASLAEALGPVDVVVMDDEAPLFVGLRNELRPLFADVDVVIGGSFLARFGLDLDYPAQRLIFECAEGTAQSCRVLPFCAREGQSGPPCE